MKRLACQLVTVACSSMKMIFCVFNCKPHIRANVRARAQRGIGGEISAQRFKQNVLLLSLESMALQRRQHGKSVCFLSFAFSLVGARIRMTVSLIRAWSPLRMCTIILREEPTAHFVFVVERLMIFFCPFGVRLHVLCSNIFDATSFKIRGIRPMAFAVGE